MTTALLIIDVQKGMFAFPDFQPFNAHGTVATIRSLLDRAREAGAPVVFVKHDGPDGPLAIGQPLHEIADEIAPQGTEAVITKTKCGAFNGTLLKETLDRLGASKLVICGLQTDFCVDTAVRTAPEYGFQVIVARGAHTTFDTQTISAEAIIAHHEYIWPRQFGLLLPADAIVFGAP
jgi:nicotinamidase-related amidase